MTEAVFDGLGLRPSGMDEGEYMRKIAAGMDEGHSVEQRLACVQEFNRLLKLRVESFKEIRLESHMVKNLLEYSSTLPTGVYPGKMWRTQTKKTDPIKGTEVEGLEGRWAIGVYMPKDEKECQLTWLPLVVVPYADKIKIKTMEVTEHCYNEECQYLRIIPGLDDIHHSPNCRGTLTRRAHKAERQLAQAIKERDEARLVADDIPEMSLEMEYLTQRLVELNTENEQRKAAQTKFLDAEKAQRQAYTDAMARINALETALVMTMARMPDDIANAEVRERARFLLGQT